MFRSDLDEVHESFQILLPLSPIYRDAFFIIQRYLGYAEVAEKAVNRGDYLDSSSSFSSQLAMRCAWENQVIMSKRLVRL